MSDQRDLTGLQDEDSAVESELDIPGYLIDNDLKLTEEEAISESYRNLSIQLAIPRCLRKGRRLTHTSRLNPNPRLWKYTWQVFVLTPFGDMQGGFVNRVCAMPEIGHADFMRWSRWLEEERISFAIANWRQRREHDIWNEHVVAEEDLATRFEEDPDAIADDGRW